MIDAMSKRFDMSVEHGASAAAAHAVPGSVDVEPFLGLSAPPPVIEPRPVSRKSSSVSGIDMRKIRLAR